MLSTTISEYGKRNSRILIMLTGWGNQQWMYLPLATVLARKGFRIFVVTYDAGILSPDIEKTVSSFLAIRDQVVKKIRNLRTQGHTDISLYGVSLGSSLAFMIANDCGKIQKLVVNLTGANIAESVWSWDIVNKVFKQTLVKNGMTLEKLKKEWYELSPENNLTNLKQTQILLQATKRDEIIPFEQTEKLITLLKNKNISVTTQISSRFAHLLTGAINVYNNSSYVSFLKK
jgi:esterase/lipase